MKNNMNIKHISEYLKRLLTAPLIAVERLTEWLLFWPLTKLFSLSALNGLGELIVITIGSIFIALSLQLFLWQVNHIAIGVGGLSLIAAELFRGSILEMQVYNIPIFTGNLATLFYVTLSTLTLALGALKNKHNSQFVLMSFAGIVLVGFSIDLLRYIGIDRLVTLLPQHALLLPIYGLLGGALLAVGVGIISAVGGSTAGPDLICSLLSERADRIFNGKFSGETITRATQWIINGVIALFGVLTFRHQEGFHPVLYIISTGLAIWIISPVVCSVDKIGKEILQSYKITKENASDVA